MIRPLSQKLKSNRGFTLAETLVALALIVILLGISLLGIVGYVKNMRLTEMDSTARQVFLAAQNHLTSAEVTGKLSKVEDANRGKLMDTEPQDFPESMNWPGKDQDEFYFITYSPKDVGTKGNLETSILKDMLPFGAIDEEVRKDGSYVIEYNSKTASVYGVFYTDEDVAITEIDILELENKYGRLDSADGRIARRDYEKDGKRVTIGYYGGAMAENLEARPIEAPLLEIVNEEKLSVKITDSNYFQKQGSTQLLTDVTVTITGKESKKSKVIPLELNGNTFTPGKKNPTTDPWWTVEKRQSEDGKTNVLYYELFLDDLTTPGGQFAAIFKEFTQGEDITVDVKCKSDTVSTFKREATGEVNSLFAAATTSGNPGNVSRSVEIEAVRHLQNLEPKVSNINMEKAYDKICIETANQIKSLDWKDFYKDKGIYAYDNKTTPLAQNSFYGIYNERLIEYNGGKNSLENFVIKPAAESTDSAGLFRSVKYGNEAHVFRDLKLVNFDVEAGKSLSAGTLIGGIKGDQPNVSDSNSVTIKNVVAVNGKVTANVGLAGGLIGEVHRAKFTVEGCAAAVKVTGGRHAGGILGSVDIGRGTIESTYVGGQTKAGVYSTTDYNVTCAKGEAAGGLVGNISNSGPDSNIRFTNCYSTASVKASGTSTNWGLTPTAGGFIGRDESNNTAYTDCYATGLVDGGNNEGAFAATVKVPPSKFTNCRFLSGINGLMEGIRQGAYGYDYSSRVPSNGYGDLAGKDNVKVIESYPFDGILSLASYPFITVNNTGAKVLGIAGVHYGDWPLEPVVEEIMKPTEVMFAYIEPVSSDEYKWYIKGITEDRELGIVKNDFHHGYGESMSPRGQGSMYGILVPNSKIGENNFKGPGKNFYNFTAKTKIVLDSVTYYFYPILESVDDGSTKTPIEITSGYKENDGGTFTFTFTPIYAATIGKGNP